MTTVELSNEFDIHYNSIAGQSAPGIDSYEKSVFFTKAQLELIKNYYDPLSNRKQKGFESTEKRRIDLEELVKDFKSTTQVTSSKGIDINSKFFSIPNECYLIINERVSLKSTDPCLNNLVVDIKPTTHDEYNIQKKNPFKQPDKSIVWRLNISKENNTRVVELVSPYTLNEYHMRYIKFPKPIILDDLITNYPGENLSIDGQTTESTSELHESIHREIVDRAVELALRDYKPQGLESKIQLDVRNE